MPSDFIVDVTEADFEYEVLTYSQNLPVLADFWATWCRPCKTLEPILERLISEANGGLRLARIDVDQNPNLAIRYSVRTIPTVKAFSDGGVVGEFVGLQPENRIREFIAKITPPSPLNLEVEKAESVLVSKSWSASEKMFRQILEQNPDHPAALLGLAKSLLAQGKSHEALNILQAFPVSKEYALAEILLPLAEALEDLRNHTLIPTKDLDYAYLNSIRLVSKGNIPSSIDGLLDILRQDRRYGNNSAKRLVLSLLELMGTEDPQTRQYRSELASILF